MSCPVLLMTRTAFQSQAFVDELGQIMGRAPDALTAPVLRLEIVPMPEPHPDVTALIFTSANGVRAYVAQHSAEGRVGYCVGSTTGQLAEERGFVVHDAAGDGRDLLEMVAGNAVPGDRFLHISGERTAVDLVQELSAQGIAVDRCVAYRQVPIALSGVAQNLIETTSVVAPIFSPDSARIFGEGLVGISPKNLHLVAISENAAAPLSDLGAKLSIVPSPTRAAMLTAVKEILENHQS